MSYEHKDNTGSLFKNDKRTKDTQAQAVGSAVIDGVAYWMDAWTNEKNGAKYQSLKFRRKDNQAGTKEPSRATPGKAFRDYPSSSGAEDDGPPF